MNKMTGRDSDQRDDNQRYCERCKKAHKACICGSIEAIDNPVPLIILQHPSEVNQAIGTARILSLSLSNCQLIVGEDFSGNDALNQALSDPDTHYSLLYPGENAVELAAPHPDSDASSTTKQGIILLDGTWRKAYKMFQLSSNLHPLPLVSLGENIAGNYRIRKSPKAGGLSTVEAGFTALSLLTGNPEKFRPLINAFEAMIRFQISQMPPGVYQKHYGKE